MLLVIYVYITIYKYIYKQATEIFIEKVKSAITLLTNLYILRAGSSTAN